LNDLLDKQAQTVQKIRTHMACKLLA